MNKTENDYTLAGWLAIAAAVLILPSFVLSIATGTCFVTFFLSPLGGLIDTAANIVLAMLFLKIEDDEIRPELV